MKKKIGWIIIFLSFFAVTSIAQKYDVAESNEAIAEFKEMDAGIANLFSTAFGYAVIPSVGKGAVGIGGAGGKGTLFKQGGAVADVKMSQVTIGFQFGGQSYAEVIFFEDADAYSRFVDKDLEFAAQASAVALTAGASADAAYEDGVMIFTMAKGGLMYEASVGGQKFKVTPY